MQPPDPKDVLKRLISEAGVSQSAYAKRLTISPSILSMTLSGDRPFTAGLILRLGTITGIPAEIWAKQAKDYDKWSQSAEGQQMLANRPTNADALTSSGLDPGLMVDTQILDAIEMGLLNIDPFHDSLLQPASYDFRIGEIVLHDLTTATEDGHVVRLQKGETAMVKSFEKVAISNRIAGRISIPTTLVMGQIFVSYALQIDPGYTGHLYGAIENRGTEPHELRMCDSVIFSVEFHALSRAPKRRLLENRPAETLPARHWKSPSTKMN